LLSLSLRFAFCTARSEKKSLKLNVSFDIFFPQNDGGAPRSKRFLVLARREKKIKIYFFSLRFFSSSRDFHPERKKAPNSTPSLSERKNYSPPRAHASLSHTNVVVHA
jgi:hypothetical protein